MSNEFEGRVALVTGASRGIGYHLARELGSRGAHVVAIARTVGGLEELDDEIRAAGGSATLVPLDLSDLEAIDRLGGSLHERWGRLDILVANAGALGVLGPIGHIQAKVYDATMRLNVDSTWRLIRTTDRLLRAAPAGRAIYISSGAAHSARAFWSVYAASKAAGEALVKSWANETGSLPLRVNSVNPGGTRTAMRALAMPGEDPSALPTPADVARAMLPLFSPTLTQTGQLFDVRRNRFLTYRDPD